MQIQQAIQSLFGLGLERLDAQLLVLHALDKPLYDRAWLLAHSGDEVPVSAQEILNGNSLRRLTGEPLAYITGHKEFYGLDLHIDARVLDPRADTEALVDWVLDLFPQSTRTVRVMDLGTGSGAIALALQHQRTHWQVHALDFSTGALAVAQANAQRLQLPVIFRHGTWLQDVHERFNVIASNPPYIAALDHHLAALKHEPPEALASGTDGLNDIRTIIAQAPQCLEAGGWLLLEHGYDQAEDVRQLLRKAGFNDVQSRNDLACIERCSGGCWVHART
jgi:release factor glutamine methyltransferase